MPSWTPIVALLIACVQTNAPPTPGARPPEYSPVVPLISGDRSSGLMVFFAYAGDAYRFRLRPHASRSDTFTVSIHDDTGVRTIAPPPVATYRGALENRPRTAIHALRQGDRFTALITLPDRQLVIEPHDGAHIIYDARDRIPPDRRCRSHTPNDDDATPPTPRGAPFPSGTVIAQIGWDIDHDAFLRNGSDVDATVARTDFLMNIVNDVFERDAGVTHTIEHIAIRTTPDADPYTTNAGGPLLAQLATQWNRPPLRDVERDVVHLVTGRDIDNNATAGVAFVGTICNPSRGVSASEWAFNIADQRTVVAHELGHNWGADHCDNSPNPCRLMCATLTLCDGGAAFGVDAIDRIAATRDAAPCLVNSDDLVNTCTADFDADAVVDLGDFGRFSNAFGTRAGDPAYDNPADFDNDGDVDLGDFGVFGAQFGRTDCLSR
ncbi:MAG: zinc-dependent metalloprotease family protein [Planctomycetota bacterium]